MEFVTATMHRHRLERDENLLEVFKYFDKDGNGFVFSYMHMFLLFVIKLSDVMNDNSSTSCLYSGK